MPLERPISGFLQDYKFYRNEQMPTVGLLRLKTDRGLLYLTMTKQSLAKLEQACRECSEELKAA